MTRAPAAVSSRPLARLRRFTFAAIVTNVVIVFTGGLVRVTGSGLGCPTWPTCDGDNLVPVPGGAHAGWQAALEFGNRLLTFVVLAAAIAVFVEVRRTRPHAAVIERCAWILPLGVIGQAILGGITVLTGLLPVTVAGHFLLSMALIATAVIVHEHVVVRDTGVPRQAASRGVQHATTALAAVAAVVLILGTIVTGAGPHGGDIDAPRLDIDIRFAAIAHADAVWMLLGLTVALVVLTWRQGPPELARALRLLLAVEIAQGIIGYTQYVLGVPEALVAVHILGAALLWLLVIRVWIVARVATPASQNVQQAP